MAKSRAFGCGGNEACSCGCSSGLGAGPGRPGGPGGPRGPGGGVVPSGPVSRRQCNPAAACPELPPGWPNTIQGKRSWALVHERYKKTMGISGLGSRPLSPISWGKPVDTNFDSTQAIRIPNRQWHHPRGYQTLKDEFAGLGSLGCCRPMAQPDSYRCDSETTSYTTQTPDQPMCDSAMLLVAQPESDPVNSDPYAEPAQLVSEFSEKQTYTSAFTSEAMPDLQATAEDVMSSVLQAQDLVAQVQGSAQSALELAAQKGGYASVQDFVTADPMTASAIQAAGKPAGLTREQLLFGAALAVVAYGFFSSRKK